MVTGSRQRGFCSAIRGLKKIPWDYSNRGSLSHSGFKKISWDYSNQGSLSHLRFKKISWDYLNHVSLSHLRSKKNPWDYSNWESLSISQSKNFRSLALGSRKHLDKFCFLFVGARFKETLRQILFFVRWR